MISLGKSLKRQVVPGKVNLKPLNAFNLTNSKLEDPKHVKPERPCFRV